MVLTTHYMEEAEVLSHRVAIIDAGRIRALDTPSALIHRLGDGHRVGFTLDAEVEDDALFQLPGVLSLDRGRNGILRIDLAVADPTVTVPALYSLASVRGVGVSDLRVEAPDLETVFLNVTGTRLRD